MLRQSPQAASRGLAARREGRRPSASPCLLGGHIDYRRMPRRRTSSAGGGQSGQVLSYPMDLIGRAGMAANAVHAGAHHQAVFRTGRHGPVEEASAARSPPRVMAPAGGAGATGGAPAHLAASGPVGSDRDGRRRHAA